MINLIFRSYYILFHLELTLIIYVIVNILPSLFQFYYPKVGFHLLILYIKVNKGMFSKIYLPCYKQQEDMRHLKATMKFSKQETLEGDF